MTPQNSISEALISSQADWLFFFQSSASILYLSIDEYLYECTTWVAVADEAEPVIR